MQVLKRAARFAFGEGGTVKARVLRSGLWVGVSEIGMQTLNIVRSVALARLLTPEVFGLMGLAMIVVRAVETFTRPGVAQALIARQQAFDEASATAYTLLVARGLLLALLLAVAAPFVAQYYAMHDLAPMLQVMSLVFLFGGFANINTIARQRELDFRRLAYLGQATNLIGTIVTIGAAYWLRSVWALVIGQIATAILTVALSYVFIGGRVRFAFDAAVARDLLKYGKFITGSSIVIFIAKELDSAVIGKISGAQALGFYTLALTISGLATLNLSKLASSVMMPAYSKLQSDKNALRAAYLQALGLVMLVVTPASIGLIVLADPLIFVVYGEKWMAAALPLQILTVFGLLRALLSFDGYLFEGMGMPRIAFQLGLLRLAVIAPLIVPAVKAYGLNGAAAVVAFGGAVQWLAGLVYLRMHLAVGFRQVAAAIARPLWTSLLMGAGVYGAALAVNPRTLPSLLLIVLVGAAIFVALNGRNIVQLAKGKRLASSRPD